MRSADRWIDTMGSGPASPEPLRSRVAATAWVLAAMLRERRAAFWSERELRELRDARLRALVRHAAEHVPHYRDLFREQGIDARELETVEDLRMLPLLEKQEVQREPERFRSESAEGRAALPFPTSGSSGTPLVIHHERKALLRHLAAGERTRGIERRLLGPGANRTITISHPRATGARARAFYRRATFIPARPGRNRLSVELPVDELVRLVNARRPDVIAGWGSSLESLFRLLAEGTIRMHRPKLVRYFAEAMSDDARKLIEERLSVPVISSYSAVETFRIGFFCERRTGFHLHDDLSHVRVVRPDGTDADADEVGEVVITNLVNRGTLLINYRLGDLAALLPEPCSCGRESRLLGSVQGRVSEIVTLPDGSRVHPFAVASAVREEGLLRFQLIQEAPRRFRLDVVTTDDAALQRVVDVSAVNLRRLLQDAELTVARHDELDQDPRLKFRRVVALPETG